MLRINRNSDRETVTDTVGSFKSQSIYYPDFPNIKWQDVALGNMASSTISSTNDINICVIGRGASALSVMNEISLVANKNSGLVGNITINNIYYDSEAESSTDVDYGSKWGRIFAVKPGSNQQEIGCMRFPSIAVLTWNYISLAYPDDDDVVLTLFPNPGKVQTQFLFRDMNVIFKEDASGVPVADPDMNNPVQLENFDIMNNVKNGVINYLLSLPLSTDATVDTNYFAGELIGTDVVAANIESYTLEELNVFWNKWDVFSMEYDIPLIDEIKNAINSLIADGTLIEDSNRDSDYYIELFGRYGFGTGGFRTLNNVTVTEICRLLIWNYSNEYLFPNNNGDGVIPNSSFAQALYDKIDVASTGLISRPSTKALFLGRVVDDENNTNERMMVLTSSDGSTIVKEEYDYVFVCTSHHAAQKLVEPFAGLKSNETIQSGTVLHFDLDGDNVVKKYALDTEVNHPVDMIDGGMGKIYSGLKRLHMMRSTKYFSDIDTATFDQYSPTTPDGSLKVKMVISDTDFAASYFLDGQDGTTSALISYTWGDESSNEASKQYNLGTTAGVNEVANPKLRSRHSEAGNRITAANTNAVTPEYDNFWVSNLLADTNNAAKSGYMYDWTADPEARGGFKLDWAGETAFSKAISNHYRDSTTLATGGKTQRVYLAGDSMSHYGGWLEGAFMSAITAVSAFVYNEFGYDSLSPEGKKLFQDENYVEPE